MGRASVWRRARLLKRERRRQLRFELHKVFLVIQRLRAGSYRRSSNVTLDRVFCLDASCIEAFDTLSSDKRSSKN